MKQYDVHNEYGSYTVKKCDKKEPKKYDPAPVPKVTQDEFGKITFG